MSGVARFIVVARCNCIRMWVLMLAVIARGVALLLPDQGYSIGVIVCCVMMRYASPLYIFVAGCCVMSSIIILLFLRFDMFRCRIFISQVAFGVFACVVVL